MTKRAVFLVLVAAVSFLITYIVWFLRESFREFDELFISPEEEAW